jgi:ABC transporter.
MVDVKKVTKRYGTKTVVDGVTVQIEKGKITSFIGPNGAGKSTLLSMISRLIMKDEGEIIIDGKDITKRKSRELAQKISILRQTNFVNLKLTVRELVSFGRFPYSQGRLTGEDRKFVDEALDYMNLRDIENEYLDELSGGQRQRAFIAMVIAQDTDYILLDEPLNNLDMKHSVQIMKTLRRLVDEMGKTVVLVLHDINFASVYSDYIVALKNGKIVKMGTTEEMIRREVLQEIYDMDMTIQNVRNCRICVYFS